ncbi:hypothetical protein [Legionella londiniensis]|uniref:Lipoprotein n=1 Tax=Legionella londiniensis TaxID=45068 RepID=A0A0W0VJQ4_9GAMM|nr:hypothetical protein [Legionella londiniensis]KTD20328.1 hypothetical protein Llon_1681 [Legionella londiniensis]STX93930.1 Uncharacterised protein [Legionella londiniensis]
MKKLILSIIAVSALSTLVGCGFRTEPDVMDKDAAIRDTAVYAYEGRVVTDRDLVVYRKNPRHVFVYEGVKYRVKPYNNTYVYYHI